MSVARNWRFWNTILGLVLLSGGISPPLQGQDERVISVAHDRFGSSLPGHSPEEQLKDMRRADRLRIEFHSIAALNLLDLILPDPKGMQKAGLAQAFVYPADPFLIPGAASERMRTLPPGPTSLHVFAGQAALRVRVSPLDSTQALAILNDSVKLKEFRAEGLNRCYPWSDQFIHPRPAVKGSQQERLALRKLLGPGMDPFNPLVFEQVEIEARVETRFLRLELMQSTDSNEASVADCQKGHPSALGSRFAKTVGVTLVEVKPEVDGTPFVRWRQGLTSDDLPMEALPGRKGVWVFESKPLSIADYEYQVCFRTLASASRSAALNERCLPDRPVPVVVRSGLPGNVRLQPGVFSVNQLRDVRLSIGLVFITDRAAYFGRGPRKLLGGYLNPSLGFQVGGSTNQIVTLMGLHLHLIDEAGLVGGLRFGNETSSTPYRWKTNWYVGFSLDPALFDLLNNRRTESGPR